MQFQPKDNFFSSLHTYYMTFVVELHSETLQDNDPVSSGRSTLPAEPRLGVGDLSLAASVQPRLGFKTVCCDMTSKLTSLLNIFSLHDLLCIISIICIICKQDIKVWLYWKQLRPPQPTHSPCQSWIMFYSRIHALFPSRVQTGKHLPCHYGFILIFRSHMSINV